MAGLARLHVLVGRPEIISRLELSFMISRVEASRRYRKTEILDSLCIEWVEFGRSTRWRYRLYATRWQRIRPLVFLDTIVTVLYKFT